MSSVPKKSRKSATRSTLIKRDADTGLIKLSTWEYINERRIASGKAPAVKVSARGGVKGSAKVAILPAQNMQSFVVGKEQVAAFEGITFETFRDFVDYIQLSQEDLFHVFGLSESTYHRRRNANAVFVGQEADAIVRVAEVYKSAEDVFENPEKAHSWMKSPRKYLGGKRPVDLLSSSVGIEAVKSYLTRIDQGIFA